MTLAANPPPLKIPDKIYSDPELRSFFQALVKTNQLLWERVGTRLAVSGNVGLYGATPVDQASGLTATQTTITHTAPSSADYAIQDLIDSGVGNAFGFASKDEGNTVLQVIANLQTRVNELEAGLDASTGIGVFQ